MWTFSYINFFTMQIEISDIVGLECQHTIASNKELNTKLIVETLLGRNSTIVKYLIYHNNGLIASRVTLEAAVERYNEFISNILKL